MVKKKGKKVPLGALLVVAGLLLAATAAYYLFTVEPPPAANLVRIYFFSGDKLIPVPRPLAPTTAPLKQAIMELLGGPLPDETEQGVKTLVPAGTRLLHLYVKNGVAILNFNRKLENYGGGTDRIKGVIAQIVYTATEVAGVEKAWIWIEGNKELVLGGEGLVLDKPLGRADLRR
jgi:spore germination protein GerM